MSGASQTDPVIVVGVDGSRCGREALTWAVGEARLRNARVRAVHARTTSSTSAAEMLSCEVEQAIEGAGDVVDVEHCVITGQAAEVLVQASADAALLVVGSRGHRALAGTILGSVAQHCLHHAACPVAVVHAAHHGDRRRIVVGVDRSAGAQAALEWAAAEALRRETSILAVHAHHEPSAVAAAGIASAGAYAELRDGLERSAEQLLEQAEQSVEDVPISTRAVHGAAADALLSAASDAEVLVVGSRGRGSFASLILGSVSQRCATRAGGVVVVITPGGASADVRARQRSSDSSPSSDSMTASRV